MNPTYIAPKSPLFLSLSTLNKPCLELHNLVNDPNASKKELVEFEQTLWKRIKDARELNDENFITHFIGYYQTLLLQVGTKQESCDLLQYHIQIRLGDLNRYIDRISVAEYYYCNARNLFPSFGHAYNQLALLTSPKNLFRCCYYYARAAKSLDRPLTTIAGSNLRIAVGKYECALLFHVLNDDTAIDPSNLIEHDEKQAKKVPKTGLQWFYVMVIAIYNDNIQSIAKLFLNYMSENFSTQRATMVSRDNVRTTKIYCDKDSYLLLTCLDILLDWLNLSSQGKKLLLLVSHELRRIRSCLHITLMSMKHETFNTLGDGNSGIAATSLTSSMTTLKSMDTTGSSAGMTSGSNSLLQDSPITNVNSSSSSKESSVQPQKFPALPHDYVLRGFKPLESVHKQVVFTLDSLTMLKVKKIDPPEECSTNDRFIESDQLRQFLFRIRIKMDAFGLLIKRRTRNIALESILSNMTNANTN